VKELEDENRRRFGESAAQVLCLSRGASGGAASEAERTGEWIDQLIPENGATCPYTNAKQLITSEKIASDSLLADALRIIPQIDQYGFAMIQRRRARGSE
jgi:hypothetical protein